MGEAVPVWDIRDRFGETNLLVVDMRQASDLAYALGRNTAVLMRGHGCVVVGSDIRTASVSAIFMQLNARQQMNAIGLGDVRYLSADEIRLASAMNLSPFAVTRLWECWTKRVMSAGFGCSELATSDPRGW
jgi:ribulose-5-phosphate 4-epimerase/fuculose-1-phosphate aldolase